MTIDAGLTELTFPAVRVTVSSAYDFAATRDRFDEQVPRFDQLVALDLVLRGASWPEVETAVGDRAGPTGFVALSRLDQGALMSLHGTPVQATQYLVGNPVIARMVVSVSGEAALYAPFPVAIYGDTARARISYTTPSSLLGSLGSAQIAAVAADLDERVRQTVQQACAR